VAEVLGDPELVEVEVFLACFLGQLLPVVLHVLGEVEPEVLQVELQVGVELVHLAHLGTPVQLLRELLPQQPLQVVYLQHLRQELLYYLLLPSALPHRLAQLQQVLPQRLLLLHPQPLEGIWENK